MIIIKNKIESKYKNVYTIEVIVGHGDADFSETIDFRYPENKLENLERDYYGLSKLLYLGSHELSREILANALSIDPDALDWPWDRTCEGCDYYASIDQISIYYYDNDGQQYNCEISKGENNDN